jgi:uncharacterized protein
VYATGELEQDVVVAGEVEPILTVSTSGTDSDFVVKLIDVYPNDYPDTEPTPDNHRGMSGVGPAQFFACRGP